MTVDLKHVRLLFTRKDFTKKRIPGSCCMRKESTDMDLFVSRMNGDRIIMKPITIINEDSIKYFTSTGDNTEKIWAHRFYAKQKTEVSKAVKLQLDV